MSGERPESSAARRLLRIGGLVGRVGASIAGERLLGLARPAEARTARRQETLVANAVRIVETLGELKGAAMKLGQMLSLHDPVLPPEVAAVLRTLQKQARPMPFEVVGFELDAALPRWRELFADLEPAAFAAASIGQVHRGTLADGRRVAVKIQYPLIDRIIEADLGNLRLLMQSLFALVSEADFEPIWAELSERLREELDYEHEADNLRRMAALHAEVPEIVIPRVVDEASSRRVLTLEYLGGLSPDEACSERVGQELRDRWGRVLFEFLLRGLYRHRLLHADPNLANFAFLPSGRVVVYDFGCVKRVPEAIASGYAALARAALAGDLVAMPDLLAGLGVHKVSGEPLALDVVRPYLELVGEILRAAPPFRFGENDEIYRRLFELGWANVGEATGLVFPRDIVFVDRAIAGHLGNLSRLRAAASWGDLLRAYVD